MSKVPLGSSVQLPNYIKNSKSIWSLTCNEKTGKAYEDQNCFFRCLSLHQGANLFGLEKPTKRLKLEFEEHTGLNFDDGMLLEQVPAAEIKFNVAINILSLKEDGNADIIYIQTRLQAHVYQPV